MTLRDALFEHAVKMIQYIEDKGRVSCEVEVEKLSSPLFANL
jgi:hypothetical protein